MSGELERVRRIYDESASSYDRKIRFPERLPFRGGREWVCSQARGEVLDIAIRRLSDGDVFRELRPAEPH